MSDQEWHDAGVSAFFAWERFAASRDPLMQAHAVVDLSNAMSDLASCGCRATTSTPEPSRGETDEAPSLSQC